MVVPLSKLQTDEQQPRRSFDPDALAELSKDIDANGLINPLTVYQEGDAYYIVAGERRFRALKELGRADAPVRVIEKADARSVQLAENLQREDLPLIEEATALVALRDEFDLSVRALAERVKKPSSYVDRRLQILTWPADVQEMLVQNSGMLTKAAQLAKIDNARVRQRRIAELLDDGSEPPSKGKPAARPGRPVKPFKVTEKRGGGFDLQAKYRPGQTNRAELIDQLRTVLARLERETESRDAAETLEN